MMLPVNPIFLYPEIHFRFFKFFPSLLFKKTPEVVFDLPRRIGPNQDLHIVLIANDIDKFPCVIDSVDIACTKKSTEPKLYHFDTMIKYEVTHAFAFQQAVFVFKIPRRELENGLYFINCIARIKKGVRETIVINDNLMGTSKFPFSCLLSSEDLPGSKCVSYGDMHVHSHYSQSHVEFGTPISIIELFSNSLGNDFTVVTDHSYDLACAMDNYLKIDTTFSRWSSLQSETAKKKIRKPLLLGEEISCLNKKKKAVHLCAIGLTDFIPGSIDGARHGAKGIETLSIPLAIEAIHNQGAIAYAAHPGSKMGFMQKLFLKRGNWNQEDIQTKLDAIQAVNNGFGTTWNRAKKLWIHELHKGHKLPLVGGNDAHGDFNRYRYLSVPFLSIQENFFRFFSCTKTGIYSKVSSNQDLIEAIKNGRTFITTGPVLAISLSNSLQDTIVCNTEINFKQEFITLILISNYEFGTPRNIRLYSGGHQGREEKILFSQYFKNQTSHQEFCKVSVSKLAGRGYIRAEAEFVTSEKITHYTATSPCYFNIV